MGALYKKVGVILHRKAHAAVNLNIAATVIDGCFFTHYRCAGNREGCSVVIFDHLLGRKHTLRPCSLGYGCHIGAHMRYRLKTADGLAELLPLLGIGRCVIPGRFRDARQCSGQYQCEAKSRIGICGHSDGLHTPEHTVIQPDGLIGTGLVNGIGDIIGIAGGQRPVRAPGVDPAAHGVAPGAHPGPEAHRGSPGSRRWRPGVLEPGAPGRRAGAAAAAAAVERCPHHRAVRRRRRRGATPDAGLYCAAEGNV